MYVCTCVHTNRRIKKNMRKGVRSKTFLNSKIQKILKRNRLKGFCTWCCTYVCMYFTRVGLQCKCKPEKANNRCVDTKQQWHWTVLALEKANKVIQTNQQWHHSCHVALLVRIGTYLPVIQNAVQKHDCSWMAFWANGPNTQKTQNSNNKNTKFDVECNLCDFFLSWLFKMRCSNYNAFKWLLEQS